jgi:3-oxoadipate enol-lactonase
MKERLAFSFTPPPANSNTLSPSVESTPFRLQHNGCQLHYWMTGPLDAPLVVLTHGEGANHHSFDAQVQILAQSCRVLAWDIRGHGKSVSDQPFSLEMAVDDLHAILTHEEYSQAILVGLSAGGTITQRFAQRFPEAVLGIALLSCIPIQAVDSTTHRFFGRLTVGLVRSLPYWFIRAQMPAYCSIRPEVQKYVAEAMAESGAENFLAAWQIHQVGIETDSAEFPKQPLLVALGAYDTPGWVARATALWAQADPTVRPVIVPGAGHALVQDNPAYCNKMLEDFLYQCIRANRHA